MAQHIQKDIDLVRLAREVAIDHYDIDDVLTRYNLSYEDWSQLLAFPRFAALLTNEDESWRSAKNTKERVKLKAAALIEGYLEAAQASLHDKNETLVAKTGLAKLVAGFAGLGGEEGKAAGTAGSGFSITINLGDRTISMRDAPASAAGALEIDEFDEVSEENSDFEGDLEVIEGSDQDDEISRINADLS